MLCSEATLVNPAAKGGVAVTLRCKRWNCEICAPFNKRAVVRRAKAGNAKIFITLTVNPAWGDDPDHRARALARSWVLARREAMRRLKLKSLPFFAVFEKTKRGEPHLHIIADIKYLDQKWLSSFMERRIGAPIVWVVAIDDTVKAANYISKYIGKDPTRFAGTVRFWTSRDWQTDPIYTLCKMELFGERWIKHRLNLDTIEQKLKEEGWFTQRKPHRLTYSSEPFP